MTNLEFLENQLNVATTLEENNKKNLDDFLKDHAVYKIWIESKKYKETIENEIKKETSKIETEKNNKSYQQDMN